MIYTDTMFLYVDLLILVKIMILKNNMKLISCSRLILIANMYYIYVVFIGQIFYFFSIASLSYDLVTLKQCRIVILNVTNKTHLFLFTFTASFILHEYLL